VFHFTKCVPFYQMCSILQNVFHFTKCIPIIPNVFRFTKSVMFYKICSLLSNLFNFSKCVPFYQICFNLPNLFRLTKYVWFTKSVQFYQICPIYPMCPNSQFVPNMSQCSQHTPMYPKRSNTTFEYWIYCLHKLLVIKMKVWETHRVKIENCPKL